MCTSVSGEDWRPDLMTSGTIHERLGCLPRLGGVLAHPSPCKPTSRKSRCGAPNRVAVSRCGPPATQSWLYSDMGHPPTLWIFIGRGWSRVEATRSCPLPFSDTQRGGQSALRVISRYILFLAIPSRSGVLAYLMCLEIPPRKSWRLVELFRPRQTLAVAVFLGRRA